MKLKVLIIEPTEIVAAGLMAVLREQSRFRLLEPLHNLDDADVQMSMSTPDVVVINPTMDGCREFVAAHDAECGFLALAYQFVPQSLLEQFGGVVDVTDSRGMVAEKIVQVSGKTAKGQGGVTSANDYELTKRETAVLVLVAKGLMNKEIADQLNVSVHTVITHRKNIMHKTGIKSVAGLTIYAMLHNLINDVTDIE